MADLSDLSGFFLHVTPEATGEHWNRAIIAHITVGNKTLCGFEGEESWDCHVTQVSICEKCRAELKKQGG